MNDFWNKIRQNGQLKRQSVAAAVNAAFRIHSEVLAAPIALEGGVLTAAPLRPGTRSAVSTGTDRHQRHDRTLPPQ
jgi:hypothetical protein